MGIEKSDSHVTNARAGVSICLKSGHALPDFGVGDGPDIGENAEAG